ncbi:MAG TPA: C45 family peptidase [Gemmataceae bacterium]|nr:C45 family peptidase [Gemmataceae bacterium]
MFCRMRYLGFLALALCGLAFASATAGEPFRFPEGKYGKGELKYRNGIPVLIVEGTPQEIGEQVGTLAVKPSHRVTTYPKEILAALTTPVVAKVLWPIVVREGHGLLANFPADYRVELEAIIKSSGQDRELLEVGNTMFDLKGLLGGLFGCSALVVQADRSATGQPIFGRNMDYCSLGYLQQYTLVTVYRPQGKHAYTAIGYAGLVGCISGINDAGLALTILETTGAPASEGPTFDPQAMPYALCYRRLLEECTSVKEAESMLRSMKRSTTTNLTLCDKSDSAVFEITPSRLVVRRPEKSISICTNHFCSVELKLPKPRNLFTTLDRFDKLERVCSVTEKLGVEDVHHFLDEVNQGELTLQTMVFEPASLKLHLAVAAGKSPSSAQPLKHLDLSPLFKNERARR